MTAILKTGREAEEQLPYHPQWETSPELAPHINWHHGATVLLPTPSKCFFWLSQWPHRQSNLPHYISCSSFWRALRHWSGSHQPQTQMCPSSHHFTWLCHHFHCHNMQIKNSEMWSKPVHHPLAAVCNLVKALHLSELYFPTHRTDM